MNEPNQITEKRMQELLPDYVFGRLSPEDVDIFESNINLFPDIQKEVSEVSQFFREVEKIDFDKVLEQQTRNLSVKVNQRLESKKKQKTRQNVFYRYIVPSLGLAAIVFFMFSPNYNEISENIIQPSTTAYAFKPILKNSDISLLMDSTLTEKDYLQALAHVDYSSLIPKLTPQDEEVVNDMVEEYYAESLSENLENLNTNDLSFPQGSTNEIMNQLENLNEEEFQELMQGLENANIPS